MPIETVFTPLALSPESISFFLLFILLSVLLVSLLSVLSSVFELLLYTGGTAIIIAILFFVFEPLSIDAALEFIPPIF